MCESVVVVLNDHKLVICAINTSVKILCVVQHCIALSTSLLSSSL